MALGFMRQTLRTPAAGLSTDVTYAASTIMATFAPANRPYRIIRWGTTVTVAPVDTGSAKLAFRGDVLPTPIGTGTTVATGATTTVQSANGYNSSNSLAFYVDTGGGTLTVPNAQLVSPAVVAIGTVVWHNVNPQATQTGGYYPAADTALISPGGASVQLVIWPGQSFNIYCTNVSSTPGHGVFWIEVEEMSFVADYNNTAAVLSGYPSSNGTTPTPSWPFSVASLNYQS
jgi:hypothetical protein